MRLLTITLTAMTLAACGGSDVLGPLVTITNAWEDEANANHVFSLTDNTNGTAAREGTFDGQERTPDFQFYELNGSWSRSGSIEFTVQRPGGNVTYRGKLTSNPNRISFTSSAGSLTLVRQQQ